MATSSSAVTLGILGGGQLGRMLLEAANRLNIKTLILDSENSSAKQISNEPGVHGSFKSQADIKELAAKCSVITVEIEHVDCDALSEIVSSSAAAGLTKSGATSAASGGVAARGITVQPDPQTLRIIQDKYAQKIHLSQAVQNSGSDSLIPISPFKEVAGPKFKESLIEIGKEFGYPMMLKSKTLAYDGRGNKVIKSEEEIAESIAFLGGGASLAGSSLGEGKNNLYVEKWVPFTKELAVMVAKSTAGEIFSYPCVETIQKDNICHVVVAPAQIDGLVRNKARLVAESVVESFSGCGIFGVELFLLPDGSITFNEVAPRPHNSGHYTIEACHTSQYEQHIRCVTGLPLGSTDMKVPASIMINIIGAGEGEEGTRKTFEPVKTALTIPGATVHLYGKGECRRGRKMGHITIVGDSMAEVMSYTKEIIDTPLPSPSPLVGIIMGSDSDLPFVKPAAVTLKDFGIPFELSIVSAHRTPDRMVNYAKTAHKRGLKVVIAAAGGAAHLPGMVAALTPLPVIGIPVCLKVLDGVDSLYSIVQMPKGVPVATVAINNAVNAALLATRILGASIPLYQEKLISYAQEQERIVLEKVDRLDLTGWEEY